MKASKTEFTFTPAAFIPFRDTAAIARVRAIKREDITRHPNPDFRISVIPDAEVEFRWISDMFFRIKTAMDAGRQFVAIMPNPWPGYAKLAALLNGARVDCRNLHTFNMDEYADQDGHIAPESWEFGFGHAFKKYFWSQLDRKLRPPEKQVRIFTDRNIKDYGRMLADLGGGPAVAIREDGALDPALGEAPPVRGAAPGADAVALILYTSGSTGRPRGVIQTHGNIAANTRSIVEYLGLGAEDRALLVLPLYYCYGRSVLQTHESQTA